MNEWVVRSIYRSDIALVKDGRVIGDAKIGLVRYIDGVVDSIELVGWLEYDAPIMHIFDTRSEVTLLEEGDLPQEVWWEGQLIFRATVLH